MPLVTILSGNLTMPSLTTSSRASLYHKLAASATTRQVPCSSHYIPLASSPAIQHHHVTGRNSVTTLNQRRHLSSSSNSANHPSGSAPPLLKPQQAAAESPDQTNSSSHPSPSPTTSSMASKLVPSNPSEVMVIRDLTSNVVTLSVPFKRGGIVKFGGRATLVRLTSGSVAVFSPVALTPQVKAKIDDLVASGPNPDTPSKISHIIALDMEHHIFCSEWKAAFPHAKLIGPAGLPEKRKKQAESGASNVNDDEFAVVFPSGKEKRNVAIDPEFDADFDYELVDPHPNKEIVFCYRPDKVLIEGDLIFNMPAEEQYSRVPESEKKTGMFDRLFHTLQTLEGDLKWPRRAQWYLWSRADRPTFNESIQRISTWDFETLIPCHGETVVGDGKKRFLDLYEWHLSAAAEAAKKTT